MPARFRPIRQMLPSDLENIVHSYVDKFNAWESLPDPKAIKRLVHSSDGDLIARLCGALGMPQNMYWEILTRFEGNRTWLMSIPVTVEMFKKLDKVLARAVAHCWQTHAIFWLFIQNPQNIYYGCYTAIFEGSLLYQLLSIVTNEDFLESDPTESTTVYLGTDGTRQQVAVFHLV